jgi:ketosteroid isomerase-like protein
MNGLRGRCVTGGVALALLAVLSGCGSMRTAASRETAPKETASKQAAAAVKTEDVKKEILDRGAQRIAAMVNVDLKTLGEILRDDLTYIHSSGPIEGKAEVLDELTTGKLRYKALEPSEVGVRVYGDTALVTGRALLKVNSQKRELAFSVRFTEVWLRTHGIWQLAAWQSTRIPES